MVKVLVLLVTFIVIGLGVILITIYSYSSNDKNSINNTSKTVSITENNSSTTLRTAFNRCENSNSGVVITFPHEIYCDKYYKCVEGEEKLKNCLKSLHFDPVLGFCVPSHKTNCTLETSISSTRPSNECENSGPGIVITFPHESDCDKFYECFERVKKLKNCTKGLYFDSLRKICVPQHKINCTLISSAPPTQSTQFMSSTTKINPSSSDSTVILPSSESGSSANNQKFTTPLTTTSAKETTITKTSEIAPSTTSAKYISSTNTVPTTTLDPLDPKTCIGDCVAELDNMYLPNIQCDKFCQCTHLHPVVIQCPENLHWSIKSQTCTYPWQAKCSGIGRTTSASEKSFFLSKSILSSSQKSKLTKASLQSLSDIP